MTKKTTAFRLAALAALLIIVGSARAEVVPEWGPVLQTLKLWRDYWMAQDGSIWKKGITTGGAETWTASTMPGNLASSSREANYRRLVARHNDNFNPAVSRGGTWTDGNGKVWGLYITTTGAPSFKPYSSAPPYVWPGRDTTTLFCRDGNSAGATFTCPNANRTQLDSNGNPVAVASGVPRNTGFLNATSFGYSNLKRCGQLFENTITQYAPTTEGPTAAHGAYTSATLPVGQYTCWMNGAGSVDIAAGTATISAPGTATAAAPYVFSVTVTGTVTLTVTDPVTRFQLQNGSTPTSYILNTDGGTVATVADLLAVPLPVDVATFNAAGSIYVEYTPEKRAGNPSATTNRFILVPNPGVTTYLLDIETATNGTVRYKAYDGTNVSNPTINNFTSKTYKFLVTWETGGNMNLYNLTDGTTDSKSYDGSFAVGNTLYIGGTTFLTSNANGCIQRVLYWPGKILTPAERAAL